MKRHLPALVLILAVASCKAPAGTEAPAAAKAKATPSAVAATAPPHAATPSFLQPLKVKSVALSGQVLVNSGYATRFGGASSVDGGALAMSGSKLISQDGGTLISQDGGTLISQDGGTIVAQGGGNVIASGAGPGASIIGEDGGTLISQDGGSLISQDGETIVAQGGGNYRLQQAAAASTQDAPAAGMWVSVVSNLTGKTVPIGADAQGHDVYTIFTNARGKFSLQIPAELDGHVRLVARAPGRNDPRLTLGVYLAAGGGDARVDERSASLTKCIRYTFALRMLSALDLTLAPGASPVPDQDNAPGDMAALLKPSLERLKQAFLAARWNALDQDRKLTLAALIADRLLDESAAEDQQATTNPQNPDPAFDAAGHAALYGQTPRQLFGAVMDDLLKNAATAPRGADMATYFAAKPYLEAANLARGGNPPYAIVQPGDMVDFVSREYMGVNDEAHFHLAFDVFQDLGLPLIDVDRTWVACRVLVESTFAPLIDPEGQVMTDVLKLLSADAGGLTPAASPAPAASLPPLPALPTPPAAGSWSVTTLAGKPGEQGKSGDPEDVSGPDARFSLPDGLALDETSTPPVLYVAEGGSNVIRAVTLDGQATVSTLAGVWGTVGSTDGDAGQATFTSPFGLALDAGKHLLYVADVNSHRIRRVTLGGGARVATVAGREAGFADGPGGPAGAARLQMPYGVALAPAGHLFVADTGNKRIREIASPDGDAPVVTTYSGHSGDGHLEAPVGEAWIAAPFGPAFGADGAFYFTDVLSHGSRIRKVAAGDTQTRLFAGGLAAAGGVKDGLWCNGTLAQPIALAVDGANNVYVADQTSNTIRMVTPDGWVSTLAGAADGTSGWADGDGAAARFNAPRAIAVTRDGKTLYVADANNAVVRRLTRR